MNNLTAEVSEIFRSVQGEGIYLGVPQVFVRFGACNISCRYCDEAYKSHRGELGQIELIKRVKAFAKDGGRVHSVSLTGGEPLCYADFLAGFLPLLRKEGLKVYLETNGTLPEALKKVLRYIDIVATDIKLPSSTGRRGYWKEHYDFLRLSSGKDLFVKVVVTDDTTDSDVRRAAETVKRAGRRAPFVLQPATTADGSKIRVDAGDMMRWARLAGRAGLKDVRVIPQIHKMLGIK